MADMTKTVVTFITLILFLIGSGFTMLGIFNTNEMSTKNLDEKYIIPSQVLNGLTVMLLLYLTSTSSFSASYKFLIIVMLVSGMLIEIYLSSYADRKAESIAAYVFIVLNFLIRVFFLIDLAQGEWVKPFTTSVMPVQKMVKEAVVKPVEEAIKEMTTTVAEPKVETPTEDYGKMLVSKWDKLKGILKDKPEGLDEISQKKAWESVVKPARNQGRKDVMTVLKEAVGELKDKEGKSIPLNSVDAVGGSRK